jgi:uncharacterized protein YndB with AHSA1/START domain
MSKETKPARVLELTVDIDAPVAEVWKAITEAPGIKNWFAPIISVTKPGVGGEVTMGWTPEMTWPTNVSAWEPGKHLQWLNDDMMGPGTRLVLDYYLSTESGKTRLRLVQSAFGESDWDDFFQGTEAGWTYFLYNLRLYLERHLGRVRHLISSRFEVSAPRDAVWRKLLSASAGLIVASGAAVKTGDWVQLKLADPATLRAVVELIIDGHVLAMRIPELEDAVLFIELETGKEKFGVSSYLSVYDEKKAAEVEAPARRAFERVKAALK